MEAPTRSHRRFLAGTGALAVAGLLLAGLFWLRPAAPAPDHAAAAVPTPPLSDPEVKHPSGQATQGPGPLVPVAAAAEISFTVDDEVDREFGLTGRTTLKGTLNVLMINEQVGKLFDQDVAIDRDGSFTVEPEYVRTGPAGSRSVIRITGTTGDGRLVETNREVRHR